MIFRTLFVVLLAIVGLGAYTSLCRSCLMGEPDVSVREISDAASAQAQIEKLEARFTDVRQGAEKEIIWFGAENERTNYAIVYVHGFTATKQELRPVPDVLAKTLKANIFYTRLAGHGRPAEAMAGVEINDWLNDVVEALNIGRAIGRKVIFMGASTGASLITWLVAKPDYAKDVAAVVFVSPNFGLHSVGEPALRLPFARTLVPLILGPTRGFKPLNEEHAYWWTPIYPSQALIPMVHAVDLANAAKVENVRVPALFVFSTDDKVVDGNATLKIVQRWGGPHEQLVIDTPDNPGNHVPAGRVLSPTTTDKVTKVIDSWLAKTLKP